jgi:thiol-disulfide isomerase/thioredoxin
VGQTETTSTRTWLTIAVVFTALWAAYLTFFGPRAPKPSLEGSGLDVKATYNWSLSDLEDRPVGFEAFKGKVVFLDFWATWCGPCVREMPSIARLAEHPRLKDKGIAFVCVSVDDETATVREFLKGKSGPMRFFRSQDVPRVFATDGIPATFIITPDGRIAASQVGAAEWDNPEVVALLEKLAAGTSPGSRDDRLTGPR